MKPLAALILLASTVSAADYDPLLIGKAALPEAKDFVVKDAKRSRDLPIRVYLPAGKESAPVVLFSHGLGGSKDNSPYLGTHWAGRGYAAVFLQHPGSDEGVWKDKPLADRMAAMKSAANLKNLTLRVGDVPAVLDQLEVWAKEKDHALSGRLDLKRVGMSGHSFGAWTTQALGGQTGPTGRRPADGRIKAAVAMSPSAPLAGDAKKAFADVKIPWMLLTGTKDDSPLTGGEAKSRLKVFEALPPGDKFELVLDGAEHSAFTERALPGDKVKRNPNHHKAILAVTTAFWDAHLRDDKAAKAWLAGAEVRKVLEKGDGWKTK